MKFNSLTFLVFFAVVLALHNLPFRWRTKKFNLLIASYLFYAAWNPPFVILLWISTVADWFVAKRLSVTERPRARTALLLVSLAVNLGMLGFFKYSGFLLANFTALLTCVGVVYRPPSFSIVLPVGISFYTFQTLSYTLDVYRRQARPWPSFLDYALFVTFFPQLVAGPIVRAVDFLPQCVEPRRATPRQLSWGLSLLALGLFQKRVLADYVMAPVADLIYDNAFTAGCSGAWLGTVAFSSQIFFDFAGYSTCAIGVAMCLGFALRDNCRFPYAAIGLSDFWRRWHTSLSSWLRDYVYIPLGGNRKGAYRTLVNVMLTMLIGGLWHGASWRFVAWGGLHGVYLVVERLLRRAVGGAEWLQWWLVRLLLGALTYGLVTVTWVFFRAHSFSEALGLLTAMFAGTPRQVQYSGIRAALVLAVTAGLLAVHWALRDTSLAKVASKCPWPLHGALLALLIVCTVLVGGDDRAFIYFQF